MPSHSMIHLSGKLPLVVIDIEKQLNHNIICCRYVIAHRAVVGVGQGLEMVGKNGRWSP